MKVFGLVFLFIIRFCFPRSQSIADVIRKRYGDKALKNVRKIRLSGQKMSTEFLNTCHKYNVVPNCLRFPVTNKTLKDSLSYSRCQKLLLNEEIQCKKRRLRQVMFEYDLFKQDLQLILCHPLILCMFDHCF